MQFRIIMPVVYAAWLLAACGPKLSNQEDTESTRTMEGRPKAFLPATRNASPNPLDWTLATASEVYADVDKQWNKPDYLAADDSVTRRLQYWVDTLYEELKAEDPARFERDAWSIPKVQLRVMKHPSINAFVSSRSVCYRSDFRFEGADVSRARAEPDDAEAVMMINSDGEIGVYRRSQVSCLDRTVTPVPAAWVAAYLRQNLQVQSCSFEEKGGRLVFAADCKLGGPYPKAEASLIKLESVTPWLTITTGALTHMASEEEVVLTLAHELVHYFQAHGTLIKSRFNYFYRQTAANMQRPKPLPDPALADLGQSLLKLPGFRTQPIEGQHYHSELFGYFRTAMQHLVKPACSQAESPCFAACQDIIALYDDAGFQSSLQRFPQAQLKGAARAAYFSYENAYAECTAAITVDPAGHDAAARVRPETVKRIYWKAALDPLTASRTLADAIEDMNRQLLAEQAAQDALLQRALDEELGYYTSEQEADLLALQWLAQLGIDPSLARDYWLRFMAASAEQDSAYSFAYDRCLQVYSSEPRWTLEGRSMRPPVGSFADPHHSKCHRLYQVDQRLAQIDFPLGADRRPGAQALGGSWAELIQGRF